MRILLAPDKFKDSLSATDVCRAMREGIASVDSSIEIDACPIADGGEGTVDAIVAALRGRFETFRVVGPLSEMKVDARIGVIEITNSFSQPKSLTAIIEMSAASGLALLKSEDRDPLATTTFGTGELINHAIELGCTKILIGLGGSATVDGGIGAAQACGLPVLLDGGEPTNLSEPLCGRDLSKVVLIKHGRGDKLGNVEIIGLCDVDIPLFGEQGAAKMFGPQKGASPDVVNQLDHDLQQLATRTGKLDIAALPGAGAAGGLGFGLAAFFGATLRPGAAAVLEAIGFAERMKRADLCLTGEGKLDAQSSRGKGPVAVARACRAANVPCIAIVGTIDDLEKSVALNFDGVFAIRDLVESEAESRRSAFDLIARQTERAVRSWLDSTPQSQEAIR